MTAASDSQHSNLIRHIGFLGIFGGKGCPGITVDLLQCFTSNCSVCRKIGRTRRTVMLSRFYIAVVTVTLTLIGLGQEQSANKDQRSSVEQAIRQLDNERIQAQIEADAVALDRIYADDFIGVGPSGTVRTKPQVISDFTSGNLKFQSITPDEVKVRVYENTAVETGLSTMVGQDKGKAVPRDTRFTRVWVKQQGHWRLVANHYSLQITQH